MEINSILPLALDAERTPSARAWLEIDREAIRFNVAQLRALPGLQGCAMLAVVKADAYGHGLIPVAQSAVEAGAEWLGVATVEEGVALRQAGLQGPIILLCAPAPGEALPLVRHGLIASVGDAATRDALAHAALYPGSPHPPVVHLEVDTGIGRAGVLPEDALEFWRQSLAAGLNVTGLMTHFSDAEGDAEFTRGQVETFYAVRRMLEQAGARFEQVHMSNSAGSLRCGAAESTLFRAGLLLYGIRPAMEAAGSLTLRPVMTIKARVATVRALPEEHPISYGMTHRLKRPSRVATVLLGYGDGYPRRLSNCGAVLLRGQRAPILGRVCMDQTVVDVTDIPGVEAGDVAVCLGAQGQERITAEELAGLLGATEHEITTCITSRLSQILL